jgi:alpha-1,2-mannosyltransferase
MIRYFILLWGTMMIWLAIFMTRPHKEERFLYPIYPLLLLSAAAGVSLFIKHFNLLGLAKFLAKLLVLAHFLISLSRLLALLFNYSASMDIFVRLNDPAVKYNSGRYENTEVLNVCMGKEW